MEYFGFYLIINSSVIFESLYQKDITQCLIDNFEIKKTKNIIRNPGFVIFFISDVLTKIIGVLIFWVIFTFNGER